MVRTPNNRELFVLDGLNTQVHGTFHKPAENRTGRKRDRIGLIFLNGYLATRSGQGDAIAGWADSFAEFGYPCFRLDLPGCGDSPGELPQDWLGHINTGGYATIAATKINELAMRFQLSGVVLVGQCSGAITCIYAAAALNQCRGLILMDPYFYLPTLPTSQVREQLHIWRLQTRIGGFCSSLYQHFKALRLALRGSALPVTANIGLLNCWKKIAFAGLPVLILKAPSDKYPGERPVTGEFDYFAYIRQASGNAHNLAIAVVEGANHTFTNRLGRNALERHVEDWLSAIFPIVGQDGTNVTTSDARGENKQVCSALK